MDILYVALIVVFFAESAALVYAFEKLRSL